MWCSNCQHDVAPEASPAGDSLVRCAACGTTLGHDRPQRPEEQSSGPLSMDPADDWQIEAEMRGVERLVASLRPKTRLDGAATVAVPHLPRQAGTAAAEAAKKGTPKTNLAVWSLVALGLALFACGTVLLGWSQIVERPDLWSLGMPLALAGQAALIVGLVVQLDGLWQSHRQTAKTLTELDDELARVRQATTLLSTSHGTAAQSFYDHLTEQSERATRFALSADDQHASR
ncbi:MAG: hypothetical protein WD872_10285 [Pirellulaceae bacterium]